MATFTPPWGAANNPLRDITWWAGLLECFEFMRDKDGTTEYLARCPAHPDEHPSLVIIHDPHSKDHPVRFVCRAGCSSKDIVHYLKERAATNEASAAQHDDTTDEDEMTPSFTQESSSRPAPSLYETTETPLWHLAGYCGVSYGWLKDHPVLTLSEDEINGFAYYVFDGVPGEKSGRVAKGRRMPPTPGVKDKTTEIKWHNNRNPSPPFWPVPARELPEEIAVTEGETDCILARYWGFDAYALTKGGGTDLGVTAMEELRNRGVKRMLIFADMDDTGERCRDGLVRLCQAVNITPVPVNLRLLSDPLLGGHKDLRDFRGMFVDQQAAHRAIREVIAQSESILDDAIPCFEDAYSRRTPDPGWLVEDIALAGCITILSARPGAGKTTVLMALAAAARTGRTFLGKEVRPHRMLLATEEGVRSLWKKREIFGPMTHVRLHSVDFEGMDENWAEQVRIMGDVARRHACDVIVVDTLFSFAVPEDDDRASKVRPIFKQLRALTRQGFSVIVTMHGRKNSSASNIENVAGSIVIPGSVDIVLDLSPSSDGEETHRSLSWVKSRMNPDIVGQPALTITVDKDDLVVLDDGTGEPDRERRLIELMSDHEWHTSDEMASSLTITQDQLRRPLEKLCQNRVVKKEKCDSTAGRRGSYRYRIERPMDFSGINIH